MSAYQPNKYNVCAHKCDQCLFSDKRIVSTKRMKEILQKVNREQSDFHCHKGTIAGLEVICRGQFDGMPTSKTRMAAAFGIVNEVDPETLVDKQPCPTS